MPLFKDTRLGKASAAFYAAYLETDVKAEGDVPPPIAGLTPAPAALAPAPEPAPAPAPKAPAQPATVAIVDETVKQLITEAADMFCEKLAALGAALPTQLASIKADYVRRAMDDRLLPVAEGEQTRLSLLKASFDGGEAHKLTLELVPDTKTMQSARVITQANLSKADAEDKEIAEKEKAIALREANRRKAA